jgi:hypothetical protein
MVLSHIGILFSITISLLINHKSTIKRPHQESHIFMQILPFFMVSSSNRNVHVKGVH